jgi:uncharacterized protein
MSYIVELQAALERDDVASAVAIAERGRGGSGQVRRDVATGSIPPPPRTLPALAQTDAVSWAASYGAERCYFALLAAGHPLVPTEPHTLHPLQALVRGRGRGCTPAILRDVLARLAPGEPTITPLHLAAAAEDDGAAVRECLAGVGKTLLGSAVAQCGMQPVHVATAAGGLASLQALLAAGADWRAKDGSGRTALMVAASVNRADAVGALVAAGSELEVMLAGETPLGQASSRGHLDAMRALLAAGAKVRVVPKGAEGRQPLFCAAASGRAEAVNLLLAAGADTTKSAGADALGAASDRGHGAIVRALLAAGVSANSSFEGFTALQRAVMRGSVDSAEALVQAGAKVAFRPKRDSDTVMHLAVQYRHVAMVEALARWGAPVDDPSADERAITPLGQAALDTRGRQSREAVVRALVRAGASVNARDATGSSPLHYAAFMACPPHVALLLELGADPLALDRKRQLPLDKALETWRKLRPTRTAVATAHGMAISDTAWEAVWLLVPAGAWARRRAPVVAVGW